MNLPPSLAARFQIVRELPRGGEADVLLVLDGSSGGQFVVKLYSDSISLDEDALARLQGADYAHVVTLYECDRVEGYWYEVLEYCEEGSLRDLMGVGAIGPSAPIQITEVVAEVAHALSHIHEDLRVTHRDIKPDNLLVRVRDPLDLVVGDFGLVRALNASVRYTRAWGTPEYWPPESAGGQVAEVSPAWDWWSLGMIVAEIALGRHPLSALAPEQTPSYLAQHSVALDEIEDDRLRLLAAGLLTRDRGRRWTGDQVELWLQGGTPPVARESEHSQARRVRFAGDEYFNAADLASAFQSQWSSARAQLFQTPDLVLTEELQALLRSEHLTEASVVLDSGGAPGDVPRRFARLLVEMNPALEPVYNGVRVTRSGLATAAQDVVAAGGKHPFTATLGEIQRAQVLTLWRSLSGVDQGPEIEERVRGAVADFEARAKRLESNGVSLSGQEQDLARAWLLLWALGPDEFLDDLRRRVSNCDTKIAGQSPWWSALRADANDPAPLLLVLLTHPIAIQQAETRNENDRLARERAAETERQAKQQQRQQRERRYRVRDRRTLRWMIGLCVTVVVPLGLGYAIVARDFSSGHDVATLSRLFEAKWFPVPEYLWIEGSAAIAVAAAAVLLLRFHWSSRLVATATAVVLLVAGGGILAARHSIASDVLKPSRQALLSTPIKVSQIPGRCQNLNYWTGTVQPTRAVIRGSSCNVIALYNGWNIGWMHRTPGTPVQTFTMMAGNYITSSGPSGEFLEAVSSFSGHRLWVRKCADGWSLDTSQEDAGTNTPTHQTLGATCGDKQSSLDPKTGR